MTETLRPLRVLLLVDDPLVRQGLASLLAGQPDLAILEPGPAPTALEPWADGRPDVVLVDLGRDRQANDADLPGNLADRFPVVSLIDDVEDARAAWTPGVRGLLSRQADGPGLAAALRAAAQGLVVFDPAAANRLIPSDLEPVAADESLTPRELEVLSLVAEGLPNKGIAARLGLSEHTAKFHVNAILRKLGAQSRTEAVVRATRRGWILL